ncbi:MAG: beta strand repeat-containing protein, partial [Flavobacteriaceae bacterium]
MYQILTSYSQRQFILVAALLFSAISWGQNADLELDDRTQIITPPQGSVAQFCSDTGSNLTFRVVNRSSGAANAIDLTTNNLVATLTLTGNTFSPSGTVTSATFNNAASSTGTTTSDLPGSGFAEFNWPVPLEFNGTGTTTVAIEIAVIGNTDAVSGNNSTSYQIEVLPNPTPPTITTNYGSSLINICPSDNVIITSSPVGNEYEFYRNNVLLGPRQSSNVFTTNSLNNNDLIEVVAYFTNNCGSPSGSTLLVNVGTIPVGGLTSNAPNNVACENEDVLFTASGGGWYEFLVNNASQGASSTTTTFNLTNITSDNIDVTVRTWQNSASFCYDEDTITIRLNSVSGVNQIGNAQTICAGDTPSSLTNNSIFTADRASEGATISYQWQSRTNATVFSTISGATSITYAPSSLATTTYFRRLIYATFNGVQCQSSAPLAASNVITVTVNPNSAASLSVTSLNNTICDGEDLIVDASASTNANSYLFYINNNPYGSIQSTSTLTIPASALSDNATITVRAFYGPGGTGCSSFDDLVIRVNEITGSNTIGNSQSVCIGEIPNAFTNLATPVASQAADGALLSYQWQSRPIGGTFNDILNATNLIYSPTTVNTTTEYRRLAVSTFNSVSCTTTSNIVQLTVTGGSAPTVSLLTGNMDYVHCSTEDIILDASSTVGALSYAFTINGIQQTGMPTSTSTYTLVSGSISDGDVFGVIAYSGNNGTGCSNLVSETLHVNTISGTNTLGGAQTICSGDDPTQLTGSVATSDLGGSISYQWQSRTGTNSFVNIGGATAQNYDPPAISVTTDFRRIVTSTVSGSICSIESASVRITADPAPTVILNGGTTPACTGDNIVFTASGGVRYEFYLNGVSMAASSTSNTISSTTLNDGEEVTVRVTNAQGCSQLSSPTTVSVSSVPSVGIISGFAADTICVGEYPVFTATPANPVFTYDFYIDGVYQNAGVTTNTFDTSLSSYTILDKSIISVIVSNAASCTSSASLTMRVLSTNGTNTISGSATICVGDDPVAISSDAVPTSTSTDTTVSYQWQSWTFGGSFTDIPGATSLTYDPSALSTTTAYRRIAYVTLGSKTCPVASNIQSAASNVVTITVNTTALPAISFISGATNDVMCEGDELTFDASGTTGATSFEFFINNISQGPSSTASTLLVTSSMISDGTPVRVHATSSTASPCYSSFTITMRVNSFSGVNAIGNGQNICENDDPDALSSIQVPTADLAGASLTYVWQSRTGTNTFSDIASTNSSTYDPPVLSTNTDFRRVARSEFNGVVCEDISNFVTIQVDPAPIATLVGSNTACLGEEVTFSATGGGLYEFFKNNVSISPRSSSNIVTTTVNNGDQIKVVVTDTNSCTAESSISSMTVTNPPVASISSGLTGDILCEGDFPVFTAGPAVAGYTYEFYLNSALQTTGVSTNTFDTAVGGIALPNNALIEVKVINPEGCSDTASLTISLNSWSGTNSITGVQTICQGGTPSTLYNDQAPTADLPGAIIVYQWQSRTGLNAFTDMPGVTGQTFTPSVLSTTTAYRRLAYAQINGIDCPTNIASATSNIVTVTVDANAAPTVSFTSGFANDTICDGAAVVFDASGTTGANFYEFFVNGLTQGASSTVATFTPVGALTDGATVTVRAYSGSVSSCFSDATITMRVIDLTPSNTVSSSQFICENEVPALMTGNVVSSNIGAVTYQWQSRTGTNSFIDIPAATSQNYSPTTALTITTDFRRLARGSFSGISCDEISNIITISVNPAPTATLIGTNTACVGEEVSFSATGGVAYEFFRNNISLGPQSSSNVVTRTDLVNGDQIKVAVTNSNSCTTDSAVMTMAVSNPPAATISSGLTGDVMCEGDFPVFTAGPANAGFTYQFFVGGTVYSSGGTNTLDTAAAALSIATTTIITVEVTNADGCTSLASLTINVNSIDGANSIVGSQSICSGEDPLIINNDQVPTANLALQGATITYQWQSRTGGNAFVNIPGANSLTYDPSALSTTTAYRRLVYSTFNGVQCPSNVASAASNIVTVTVYPNAVPSVNFTSGYANNTICDGDSVIFDASATTGANFYEFFVNGLTQGASSSVATFTPSIALTDGATVTVRAYSATLSSCFSDATITMRVIDLTSSNTVSSSQFICENEIPAAMTGNAVSSNIGVVVYQWQSRTGTNSFIDIPGATSQNYSPTAALAFSTDFRRLARASFNALSCDEASNIISVSINPAPTATLIGTNTACIGEEVSFSATGGVAYEFFRNNISLGPQSATSVVSRTDLVNGDQIKVAVTNSNSCTTESSVLTMSVSNPPAATISSGIAGDIMCEGDFPVFTAGPANAGFSYQFFVGGTVYSSGGTNTLDTAGAGLSITTNTIITVEVTNNDGCTSLASLTINVNSLDGTNSITGSQTICFGEDPIALTNDQVPTANLALQGATITYQWQSRTGGNAFVNIPGATSISYDPSALSTTTAYRRLVYSTFNGVQCPSNVASAASNSVTITVDPNAAPTVSFSSGLINDVVCDGDSITLDASGTSGATRYEYFVDGMLQGASTTVPTFTIAGGTISDGSVVKVIAYSGISSSCSSERSITISVNGQDVPNTINTASSSQTICSGDTPTSLIASTVTGTPTDSVTYQWQSRQGTNSFSNVAGANGKDFSFSAPLYITTGFRRLAINTVNGVACTTESNVITVTVSAGPAPTATLVTDQPADTACDGEDFLFTATGAASSSFEFFVNGVTQGPPSSVNTISLSLTDSNIVRVDVFPLAGGVGCPTQEFLTVRVNSVVGSNDIGGIQTICFGEDPALITSINTPTSATGSITYQWQSRTISAASFNDIAGANNITYDPSNLNTTTLFRRQVISTLNGVACVENSNTVTITVDAIPVIAGSLTSDQPSNTVCSNDPGVITFTATPTGAASYNFYVNNISVQSSSTVQTYTSSITNFTDGSIVTVRYYNASGCYSEENLTVIVNSATPGSITGAQTVCFGDTPLILTSTASAVTNGVTATDGDYQWQSSTDGTTWNDILGATSANYQPPASPPPAIYYRRQVVSVRNGVSCMIPSNDILVSVNALPVPGLTANAGAVTAAATMSICSGDAVSFIGSGGVEYEFLVNGSTVQVRSASTTYITSALSNSDEVTVMVFDSTAASACFDLSEAIEVEIAAEPVASLSSTAANNTFCAGDAVTFTAGSGGITPAYYEFKVNNFTYQNTTSSTFDPADYSITLTGGEVIEVVVSSLSSCTSVASMTMTVNGITSVGTITSSTATVCSGDVPAVMIGQTATASGAITYQWQQSLDNINYSNISGATSQNYTPTVALATTTFYRRVAYSTVNSVTCSDETLPFQVVVNPSPVPSLSALPGSLIAPATMNLCEGETATFSGAGGVSYEFFVNGSSVGARSTVNTLSLTANATGTLINNSTIFVRVYDTATGTSCFEDSDTITVFVNPTPTVGITSSNFNDEICSGDPITFTANSTAASPTFEFFIDNVSYQVSSTNIFDPADYSYIIDGGSVIKVEVTTGAASCSSAIASLTVVENEISSVGTITTATPTVCLNETIPAITGGVASATGVITYQWQQRDQTSAFADITGATSANYSPTSALVTDTFFRRITISTLPSGLSCQAFSNVIDIRVDTPPAAILTANINGTTLTAATTATICVGEEVAFYANAVAGGSYEFYVDSVLVRARADSNVYSTTALNAGNEVTVVVFDQDTASAPAGCSAESDAITIVTTPVPTLTVTSTALGNEICVGDSITFFANASIAGASYDFEVNGVSRQNGLSQSFDPSAYGITIGNGDIIAVTASTGVASCSSVTASLTVRTNAITTVGTITTATPTVCLNDVIPAMIGGAGVASGAVSYQWQRRDQTTTVFTDITGATSQNYTPGATTFLTTDTFFRRVTISNTGTTTCEAFSNVIDIRVDTPPAAIL